MYHKYIGAKENQVSIIRGVGEIGQIAASDAVEFSADYVGGEAGADEHTIERGELLLIDGAAEV